MTISPSLEESLKGAISKGIDAGAQQLEQENPVLEAVIRGLDLIKGQAVAKGGFDYEIDEDRRNAELVSTIIRTTIKVGVCLSNGACVDRSIYICAFPDGQLSSNIDDANSETGAFHPQDPDIVSLIEKVAKLARVYRQVAPAPIPAPPVEEAYDTARKMREQLARSAAPGKAGSRSLSV